MPLRLSMLVNIGVIMILGVAFSGGVNRIESDQIERPIVMRQGDRAYSQLQDAIPFVRSSPLFFLHLLKHKLQIQKVEKITTTTTTTSTTTVAPTITTSDSRICICIPFYLCNANQTIITDGSEVIDIRFRRCPGIMVCCYLPNITTPRPPTTTPRPPTTTPRPSTTSTTTARPIYPTGPPNLNCICVDISLCDPNGIVTISGEGIIDPRRGYGLCPGFNRVCCRILATTTNRPSTTMTPTTTTLAPGQIQLCFVCGNTIQCITCGIIITPGVINSRFPWSQNDLCSRSLTNEPLCQDGSISSSVEVLGPLKYSGTPQACYCVKTWMCSEDNVVRPDGLGVIDSRFVTCSSADQVCCRSSGIDLQILRSGEDIFLSSPERFVAKNSTNSFSQTICGIRDSSYAPTQPFPPDSERTYFAEFPWMVALLTKSASGSYTFQCGASMINDRAVLTAAHCVVNHKPENLMARFGQWDVENKIQPLPIQEANILAIVIHPTYYSGGLFHDVAVLVLEKSVVYSANVLPICLPEQGMALTDGTRCYGTGWGSSSFESEGKYQARELRKVNVPIVDRAECQMRLRGTRLGEHFQLHGSFICAGGEANRDTCRGDGGGPLTCQTATGEFFQAGIVSWGIGCGASDIPAVYASVSQHRQWIDKQLATYGVQ